jgi:hypothetical protein
MITIIVVFGVITYFEWRYLKKKNRKQRTLWLVLGICLFMMIVMEAIYAIRDIWPIGMVVDSLFRPIQQLLYIDK